MGWRLLPQSFAKREASRRERFPAFTESLSLRNAIANALYVAEQNAISNRLREEKTSLSAYHGFIIRGNY